MSSDSVNHLVLRVGHLTRAELLLALDERGVRRNDSAELLLRSPAFNQPREECLCLATRRVDEIATQPGPSLSDLLDQATRRGLRPCPLVTGPYLRLALTNQANAPDSILTRGRAPSGSFTVLSPRPGDGLPTGFYLRAIDHIEWLRGYQASDEHPWSPDDQLVVALACQEHSVPPASLHAPEGP